ncbi:MAG TPA: 6-bladed beta-propeller [Bacteroidales bacterium]|nr:6-bladed beta-propeller [Bacteroidales bacterium]
MKNYLIRYISIVFLGLMFVFSCRNKENKNLSFDLENLNVDIKLSQSYNINNIYSSEERIKLSTSDSSLVGMILDFKISKNRFYLLTFDGFVFSFAKNGDLIYKINKTGKGPEEYVHAMSLWVEPDDKYIKIMDRGSKSVVILDSLGHFISRWNIGLYAMKIFEHDGLNYVMDGGSENFCKKQLSFNQLFIFDNQFDLKVRFLPTNEIMCNIGIGDRLDIISVKDEMRARVLYNDTIYSIKKQNDNVKITPKYLLDYGNNAIPDGIFEKTQNITLHEFEKICIQNKYIYDIYRYLETKEHIFFTFKQERTSNLYFYSKVKKQSKIIDKFIIPFNGFKYKRNITYYDLPYISNDDYLYFILEPSDFIKELDNIKNNLEEQKWEKFKKENQEYYEFVSGLTMLDNPVIVKRKINSEMFN